MSARRSLLTATAAGALLGALWFVPSANATAHKSSDPETSQLVRSEQLRTEQHRATLSTKTTEMADTSRTPIDGRLADTGSGVDTTPYLIGGTAFLGLGAGFVAYSVRREQRGPAF